MIPPIIDVAISLVFVYLLFSVVVTWVNEALVATVAARGKYLRKSILKLLDDKFNKNWGAMLYLHPAISKLGENENRPPTYIPTSLFTMAFVDIIINEAKDISFKQDPVSLKVSYEGSILKSEDPLENFIAGINRMAESEMKALLTTFVLNSGKDFEKVKTFIGQWYEDYMERVSGWYKRGTKKVLFGIGLVVTIVFNVNSIALVDSVWKNASLRNTVVSAAETYMKSNPGGPAKDSVKSIGQLRSKTDSVYTYLNVLGLPIGWKQCIDTVKEKESITKKIANVAKALNFEDHSLLTGTIEIGNGRADYEAHYGKNLEAMDKRFDTVERKVATFIQPEFITDGRLTPGLLDSMKTMTYLHKDIVKEVNDYLIKTKDTLDISDRKKIDSMLEKDNTTFDYFNGVYEQASGAHLGNHGVTKIPTNKKEAEKEACNCDETNWGKVKYWFGQWSWLGVMGWLCTAGALSFGASFWFDMLKKLVSMKGGSDKKDDKKKK